MKILIVNNYFKFIGGAEEITYQTFNLLRNNHFKVYYWACDKKPFIEKNYEYVKYFTEYRGGVQNYIKNPIKYYYNTSAYNDLNSFIKVVKPDIIHLNCIDLLTYKILDNCKNIPTIMTVHDAGLICPATTLMYRNERICNDLYCKNSNYFPCIINKCVHKKLEPSIRRSFKTYIDNKFLKYIDKYIAPSEILKKYLVKANIGITDNNCHIINNYLSSNKIDTVFNHKKGQYFLFIGRLLDIKGIFNLLIAFKHLSHNINLHIVGIGPEEEKLKKYVVDNNLYNVKFLGFKTGKELKDEYQNCIAVIVPSNWFEIFGMINIEAFANGKPVIASNVGGIPEIVEHNINGLLFEPANVEQLRECILKYWNNPELVIEHGKNGYKKVLTHYTEDIYYEKLIKLYEETINEYKK